MDIRASGAADWTALIFQLAKSMKDRFIVSNNDAALPGRDDLVRRK